MVLAFELTGLHALHSNQGKFNSLEEENYALLQRTLFQAMGTILQAIAKYPKSSQLQREGLKCLERVSFDFDKKGNKFIWNLGRGSLAVVNAVLRSHGVLPGHGCHLLNNVLSCSTDPMCQKAALLDETGQADAVIGVATSCLRENPRDSLANYAFELLCTVLSRYPAMAPTYMTCLIRAMKALASDRCNKWHIVIRAGCSLFARIDLMASGIVEHHQEIMEVLVCGVSQAAWTKDPLLFEDCTFVLKQFAKHTSWHGTVAADPQLVLLLSHDGLSSECSEDVGVHVIHILSSLVHKGGISAIMPKGNAFGCIKVITIAMSMTPKYRFVHKVGFRLLAMIDFTEANAKLAFVNAGGPFAVITSLAEHFWDEKLAENACKVLNMLTWSSTGINMQPVLEGLLAVDSAVVTILRPARRFLRNEIIWDEGGTSVFRLHDWQYDGKICGRQYEVY
eukprot:Sro272_g104870.2  (451) ;mRNA; r:44724-46076